MRFPFSLFLGLLGITLHTVGVTSMLPCPYKPVVQTTRIIDNDGKLVAAHDNNDYVRSPLCRIFEKHIPFVEHGVTLYWTIDDDDETIEFLVVSELKKNYDRWMALGFSSGSVLPMIGSVEWKIEIY